jgi:outer membrane protein OmpA-like peptidoglycan-associated protein
MRSIFLSIICLAFTLALGAQGLRKKLADEYFNALAYESAAPIYKDLGNPTLKGKGENWDVVRKGALSYFLSQNYTQAASMYEALYKAGLCTPEDNHNYAEVLRVLGKYDAAATIMDAMAAQNPNDTWAHEYAQDKNYFTELKLDSANFKVKKVPFSKGLGDFSPMLFKDNILFTSYRHNEAFVNRVFGWDQTFFVNTYISKPNKKGEYTSAKLVKIAGNKELVPHDGPYAISETNGLAMVTMNIPGTYGKTDIVRLGLFYTTIDPNTFPKGIDKKNIKPFEYNSTAYNVGHACFSADGNTLYFASDMPGGFGKSDIYKSTWVNGSWSKPENLGEKINTAYDEMFPSISHDGDLFFASKGWVGLGGLDIFMARHLNGSFEEAENLGYPVNTRFDDFGITLNKEGNKAYFTSNRGDYYDRIYETNMYVPEFKLDIIVTENNSNKTPLPNTEVTIKNLTTGTEEKVMTDSLGRIEHKLKKNTNYELVTTKEDYASESSYTVSTMGKLKSENFQADMTMRSLKVEVLVKIIDKETKQPLTGAKVKIKNETTGTLDEYLTDANGDIKFITDRKKDFSFTSHFHSHKDGSGAFNTKVDNNQDKLNLTFEMEMIKKGDVFVINDIYFDYNKATLRVESIQELNKLSDFLLENTNIKVELSAHTDSRGAAKDNQTLSQKRAQSCVDYLIKKGVPKANIVAKGYGESKLVNKCADKVECTEEEHQANRRTEIKVLSVK